MLNPDINFIPDAVKDVWTTVADFSRSRYSCGPQDFTRLLLKARAKAGNTTAPWLRFDGKVAIVTGGALGLGRCYSIALAKLGAALVVNDLQDPASTVDEIRRAGGKAIAALGSVLQAHAIVNQALQVYGQVDIVINNAGFLRDKSFANMEEKTWQAVIDVHLNGTFAMTNAVWPHFVRQGYGRIVNTSSTSGIYGNFGQSNYSTAVSLLQIVVFCCPTNHTTAETWNSRHF